MKRFFITAAAAWCVLVLFSASVHAQSSPTAGQQPPIAQPLIREGDLAIQLADALKLGTATSEAEAESWLGNAGIAPRNGWIADYPVTPDVVGELTQSISAAAESSSLKMGKDEALRAFQNVTNSSSLAVRGGTPGMAAQKAPGGVSAPDATVIDNYYYEQGPPAVTYYSPPPDYVYLYAWVPYPFWWSDVWFPGFYVLSDFHRVVHVRDRDRHDHDRPDRDRHDRVKVISNHFVDHRTNRVVRVDPVSRFNGRTFGGIGAPHDRNRFISPGSRGGDDAIFRGAHDRAVTDNRRTSQSSSGVQREGRQPRGMDREDRQPRSVEREDRRSRGNDRGSSQERRDRP